MSIIHRSRAFADISFRDPAIVSTLPFDPYYVRRYKTEEVLQRTVKRWVWFDEASKLDATLGTLSYLPLEIRRRIWEIMLQCEDTLSADGLWEFEHLNSSPFNLSAYYFGFGRRRFHQVNTIGLRLVSSSVRAEFEDIFLSMRTFRFNRPESLDAFVNHLTWSQLRRLRSFEIGLSVCLPTSMAVWLDSITRLPYGLQAIHFRMYPAFNDWFGPAECGPYRGNDREIKQEEFDLLDALVKHAVQRASKEARVTICGAAKEYQLSARCQLAVDAIIANNRQHRSPV